MLNNNFMLQRHRCILKSYNIECELRTSNGCIVIDLEWKTWILRQSIDGQHITVWGSMLWWSSIQRYKVLCYVEIFTTLQRPCTFLIYSFGRGRQFPSWRTSKKSIPLLSTDCCSKLTAISLVSKQLGIFVPKVLVHFGSNKRPRFFCTWGDGRLLGYTILPSILPHLTVHYGELRRNRARLFFFFSLNSARTWYFVDQYELSKLSATHVLYIPCTQRGIWCPWLLCILDDGILNTAGRLLRVRPSVSWVFLNTPEYFRTLQIVRELFPTTKRVLRARVIIPIAAGV